MRLREIPGKDEDQGKKNKSNNDKRIENKGVVAQPFKVAALNKVYMPKLEYSTATMAENGRTSLYRWILAISLALSLSLNDFYVS